MVPYAKIYPDMGTNTYPAFLLLIPKKYKYLPETQNPPLFFYTDMLKCFLRKKVSGSTVSCGVNDCTKPKSIVLSGFPIITNYYTEDFFYEVFGRTLA